MTNSVNFSWFKENSKKRLLLQYVLIFALIFMLLSLLVLLYNEVFNEQKLENIEAKVNNYTESLNQLQQLEIENNKANETLLNFLLKKNSIYLKQYDSIIVNMKGNLNIIHASNSNEVDKDSISFIKLLNFLESEISTNDNNKYLQSEYNNIKNQVLKQVLINTEVESTSSKDSLQKKGLFKRLSSALKGETEVQKEYNETKVLMKYGNEIEEVTVDELLKRSIEMALSQYQFKVNTLSNDFKALNKRNLNLINNNDSINKYSHQLVNDYRNSITKLNLQAKEQYKKQYDTNKALRLFGVWIALLVLLFIAFYLLYITKLTYRYEKMLLQTQKELNDNLVFKNKIVSMISHEIRSPLSIISLLTKQILKFEKEPDKIEMFESVNYTTDNILLLSNQILEFSKSENHKLELKKENFDLKMELAKIINSLKPLVENKGNKLKINIDIPNKQNIFSDKTKIHQLFYNLIGNANKYTNNGEINVECKLIQNNGSASTLSMKIKDSGIGISEDDLNKIMNPYQQGSNKASGYQNLGVGLGLYLCKEIVDIFEGEIDVKSKEKVGTEVAIQFDVEKENN